MSEVSEAEVYSIIGEDGFTRLVSAFYRRVPNDPVLGSMYPRHDFVGAEARLRGFLIQRFGGPDDYSQKRGHPRLRMRHAPFRVDAVARALARAHGAGASRSEIARWSCAGALELFPEHGDVHDKRGVTCSCSTAFQAQLSGMLDFISGPLR